MDILPRLQGADDTREDDRRGQGLAMYRLHPPIGGLFMSKIIRSFSLDRDVANFVDSLPDGRGKAISRSNQVSDAIRWYFMGSNDVATKLKAQQWVIDRYLEELTELRAKKCLWCRLKSRLKIKRAER